MKTSKKINLLPKERQKKIFEDDTLRAAFTLGAVSFLAFLFSGFVELGGLAAIKAQVSSFEKDTDVIKSQIDQKENAKLKIEVKKVNDVISDYSNLTEKNLRWSKFLRMLSTLPPEGVVLTSLSTDAVNKTVTLAGFSAKREAVLDFFGRLKANKEEFPSVDFYFENVARPEDLNFHFTFSVSDKVLIQNEK